MYLLNFIFGVIFSNLIHNKVIFNTNESIEDIKMTKNGYAVNILNINSTFWKYIFLKHMISYRILLYKLINDNFTNL